MVGELAATATIASTATKTTLEGARSIDLQRPGKAAAGSATPRKAPSTARRLATFVVGASAAADQEGGALCSVAVLSPRTSGAGASSSSLEKRELTLPSISRSDPKSETDRGSLRALESDGQSAAGPNTSASVNPRQPPDRSGSRATGGRSLAAATQEPGVRVGHPAGQQTRQLPQHPQHAQRRSSQRGSQAAYHAWEPVDPSGPVRPPPYPLQQQLPFPMTAYHMGPGMPYGGAHQSNQVHWQGPWQTQAQMQSRGQPLAGLPFFQRMLALPPGPWMLPPSPHQSSGQSASCAPAYALYPGAMYGQGGSGLPFGMPFHPDFSPPALLAGGMPPAPGMQPDMPFHHHQAGQGQQFGGRRGRSSQHGGRFGRRSANRSMQVWQPVGTQPGSPSAASHEEQSASGGLQAPDFSLADQPDMGSASDEDEDLSLERAAPEPEPEVCDSWEWLPEGVMKDVIEHLDFPALKRFRLVCQRWRKVADRNLQAVRPRKAKVHTVVRQFPGVTCIDLSGCQNVRNRNLAILARSDLKLTSLAIGHTSACAYGKPRITNQALVEIAELTLLTHLSLSDCSAITNKGLAVLTQLKALASLAVMRCPRVSDKGMSVLQQLPSVTAINVYGCVKITDAMLEMLTGLTRLAALHLGFTRIQDAGLAHITHLTSLQELSFVAEDVSNASLLVLTGLTGLTHLGLSNCYEVTGDAVIVAARALTGLRRLNLQNCEVNDGHLLKLVAGQLLPRLEHLEIPGCSVGERGLRALARLPSLRRLAMENCPDMAPDHLSCLSALTQLTSLQIQGTNMPPAMLRALATLPRLSELNLSDYDVAHTMFNARCPHPSAIYALAACTGLTCLDLAHISLKGEQVRLIVQKLPRLEKLCLLGCPVDDAVLEQIMAAFPRVELHKTSRLRVMPPSFG